MRPARWLTHCFAQPMLGYSARDTVRGRATPTENPRRRPFYTPNWFAAHAIRADEAAGATTPNRHS